HVANVECAKVGQTGLRTDRRKLGIIDRDLVARKLVLPGLNRRERIIKPSLGVIVGIARCMHNHASILSRIRDRAPTSARPGLCRNCDAALQESNGSLQPNRGYEPREDYSVSTALPS